MEFINELEETRESASFKALGSKFGSYEDIGYRGFYHLKCNPEVKVSIQASYGHYCTPRKTLPKEQYSEMEIAIFKNDVFANVSDVTDDTELINAFEEYESIGVYGFVPIELIERLYQHLKVESVEP